MSWKKSLIRQFQHPTGFWGSLAGWIMAHRSSNLERNRWTLDLLQLQSGEHVLEIGFGPGMALLWANEQIAPNGVMYGIDHSQVMLAQASQRNATAIQQGRMHLKCGGVEEASQFHQLFDKIYSANVVQFWPKPEIIFQQLKKQLKSGGLLATTFQPRQPGATNEDAYRMGEKLVALMQAAGFQKIRTEVKSLKPATVCVLGQNLEAGGEA